jgi:TetR/AcrR family transcriptional regulator, cholesterol catabolism regulator
MTAIAKSNISQRRKNALNEGGADYGAKRDYLIRVAATLFKEKGYQSTTLNDVARQSGMHRATVYYYFGNKEELFREAIKGVLDTNIAKAEKLVATKTIDPRAKLQEFIALVMTSYDESYPYMYVYIQEEMHEVAAEHSPWAQQMAQQTRRFEKMFMTLISQGMAQGQFRRDIPVALVANSMFGMLNWTHRWYKPGGKHSAKQVAEAFCTVFFEGIVKS